MQLYQNTTIYTLFDGFLLYPRIINAGTENYIDNSLPTNLIKEGLIFPFTRAPLGDKISLEYLGSAQYRYNTGKIFMLLRNDGVFEEYFKNDRTNEIEPGYINPNIKRYVCNDEGVHVIASHIALMAKDIHEYANLLELRLGLDTSQWDIYSIKELQQYVVGNLPLEKLKVGKVKSQYKTIWLK